MRRTKRMSLIIVSVLLVLALSFAALAEGKLLTLWNAGSKLLFETGNVSLNAQATFTYDGELFKTFNGRYMQDGSSSYMQVMLDTPMEDGQTYTGGYTVVGENGTSYAIETMTPQYYTTSYTSSAPSILTNNVMRSSLVHLGGLILDLMEDRMADAITATPHDAGTDYQIKLAPGQAPEIAGAAMTTLLHLFSKEYLYMTHYDDSQLFAVPDFVFYEDYDALFAHEYEKSFGEPLPEDFYYQLYSDSAASAVANIRYNMVSDLIDLLYCQEEEAYTQGVSVLQADGSAIRYDSYDQYLIATGQERIEYENYLQALSSWYEKQSGVPLSEEELLAILYSSNDELLEKFYAMDSDMESYYLSEARKGGYSAILVHADGSFTGFSDAYALDQMILLNSMTVSRRILYTLRNMQVETADITIRLDKDGRTEKAEGSISFITTDSFNLNHTLAIDFTASAYDYGASVVQPFDADALGVISNRDFFNGDYYAEEEYYTYEEEELKLLETVTFFGVEYKVYAQDDFYY